MLNLFVSSDPDEWQGLPAVFQIDRVLSHTQQGLRDRFYPFTQASIDELQSFPALFAYETATRRSAKLGRIDRIQQRHGEVQLRYTIFDAPEITPEQILELAWDLDLGRWEMNTTHWAVKDVDLREVLQEARILGAEELEATDPNLFPVVAPEHPVHVSPKVFRIPDAQQDARLVAVMMPFSAEFGPVFEALRAACEELDLECNRADQVWEESEIIQDVFGLIYRSSVVICDFTNRNPNVFYEAGIAHTLGRHVIPITQNRDHVPFDVGAHRYAHYLSNEEGLVELQAIVQGRLATLTQRGPKVRNG